MHGISGMGWGMSLGWILAGVVLVSSILFIVHVLKSNLNIQSPPHKSTHNKINEPYAHGDFSEKE